MQEAARKAQEDAIEYAKAKKLERERRHMSRESTHCNTL